MSPARKSSRTVPAVTPDYFRTHAVDAQGQPDLAKMVASLNECFSASENEDYFTMLCCVIDKVMGG